MELEAANRAEAELLEVVDAELLAEADHGAGDGWNPWNQRGVGMLEPLLNPIGIMKKYEKSPELH